MAAGYRAKQVPDGNRNPAGPGMSAKLKAVIAKTVI